MFPRAIHFWIVVAIVSLASVGCARAPRHRLASSGAIVQGRAELSATTAANLLHARASLNQAHLAVANCDPQCVDHFVRAASKAWFELSTSPEASKIYHLAVCGMIEQGQRFERFDPQRGLQVCTPEGPHHLPVVYHGPRWRPGEFDLFVSVEGLRSKELNHDYRRAGIGVPVIAVRKRRPDERFVRPRQLASATILIRPDTAQETQSHAQCFSSSVIEVYDPIRSRVVDVNATQIPIAGDYSAPIKLALANRSTIDTLRAFITPGQTRPEESGLFMLGPYEPGKVPVLFVHGLISDRFTWANVANELRVQGDLMDRYQIWGYEYPTGEPFLNSAARLRREMSELRSALDPNREDKSLDQMIIVGHSMGGLVAKLQVIHSGDRVWRSISSRPLDQIVIDPTGRNNLATSMFFEPSPMVSRIVFIGTPHRGSAIAQRAIGRIGSLLVRDPAEVRERHRQVIRDNPGVFSPEISRRLPTSIDLLEPTSVVLQTIESLPIDPRVQYHSIVGEGSWMILSGDSDGVVPVDSAVVAGATTQLTVRSRHTRLTHNGEVIAELSRILREHAIASSNESVIPPGPTLNAALDLLEPTDASPRRAETQRHQKVRS